MHLNWIDVVIVEGRERGAFCKKEDILYFIYIYVHFFFFKTPNLKGLKVYFSQKFIKKRVSY